MIKILMICLMPFMIQGCITRCGEETFYQTSVSKPSAFSVSQINEDLRFRLNNLGDIDIGECGYGSRRSDMGPVSLCLTFVPYEGKRMQLLSTEIKVLDQQGKSLPSMYIPDIHYSVFCHVKNGVSDCSSSLEPAVEGEVTRKKVLNWESFQFSATQAFRGFPDSQHGIIVFKHDRLRHYTVSIPFPETSNEALSIVLPPLQIENQRYVFPTIDMNRVRKSICHQFV